jgi:hypothetical protein
VTREGRLVAGRYRVGAQIGSGRSAQVHRAVDERLGRVVALKLLRPGLEPDGLRGAAGLDHPHLVHVLDAGTDDGRAFVVLELVHGVTVDRLADPEPGEALAIVAAVLAGLGHAHERGVLHLDVSPANVMVPVRRGRPDAAGVVVLDVGGARIPRPADGLVAVSPPYASPELATATGADARSDVYSAGALLFHLLTGRVPFPRAAPRDVLLAHVHARPPVPSASVPGLPAAVDDVVARALAKAPEDRFASAAEMRAAVLAAIGQVGTTVARPRPAGRVPGGAQATRELPPVPPASVPAPVRLPLLEARSREAVPGSANSAEPIEPARSARTGLVVAALLVAALVGAAALARQPAGMARTTSDAPAVVAAPTTTAPTLPAAPATGPPATTLAPVSVPELAGLDLVAAQEALAAAGLLVGDVVRADAAGRADTVLGSDPPAGDPVAAGAPVALVVATGVGTVPVVAGLPLEAARAAVVAAGFVAGESTAPGPVGAVVGTQPAAGGRALVGGVVTVLVGAPVPSPSPSATAPSPSATATPSAAP